MDCLCEYPLFQRKTDGTLIASSLSRYSSGCKGVDCCCLIVVVVGGGWMGWWCGVGDVEGVGGVVVCSVDGVGVSAAGADAVGGVVFVLLLVLFLLFPTLGAVVVVMVPLDCSVVFGFGLKLDRGENQPSKVRLSVVPSFREYLRFFCCLFYRCFVLFYVTDLIRVTLRVSARSFCLFCIVKNRKYSLGDQS